MPKRKLLGWLLAALVGLCCQASPAQAGAIQLTAVTELSPGGIVVSYSDSPNPLEIPGDGVLFPACAACMLSFSTPLAFNLKEQDGMFAPQFPPGSTLLFNTAEGPLTIDFKPGIRELGFFAQAFNPEQQQAFTFSVFQGPPEALALLNTFSVGPTDNGIPGVALFIGARGTDGSLITRLQISNTELSEDPSFVIGPLTFSEAAADQVPEPASLLLLGTALLGAGARLRQRRTRS